MRRASSRPAPLPVTLHIGVEKTGTTTLQRFLCENRQPLRMQGIAFTESCGPENNRDLATYAIDDSYFNEDHLIELGIRDTDAKVRFKAGVEARFSAEIATLRDACDHVIVSSEHLQSRLKSVAEIRTLAGLLEANHLYVERVVIYLRRPADIINSIYSTALRSGTTARRSLAPVNEHWNHICDHRRTIERWGEVFGAHTVTPRIFDRATLAGGSIIDDFCAVAGIDARGLRIPPNENASLTASGQALLRYLNAHFPPGEGGQADARRRDIIRFVDRHFTGAAPAAGDELLAACEERFGESDEWVRATFFPNRQRLFAERRPPGDAAPAAGIKALLATIGEHWDAGWSLLDELRRRDPSLFERIMEPVVAAPTNARAQPRSVPSLRSSELRGPGRDEPGR